MSVTAVPAGDKAAFEIKGSTHTMISLCLHSAEPAAIEAQLRALLARTPDFFNHDPAVLDLAALQDRDAVPDYRQIAMILRRHKLVPVGVANASEAQSKAALALGMGLFNGSGEAPARPKPRPAAAQKPADAPAEAPAPAAAAPAPAAKAQPPAPPRTAKTITTPVRTGQQVYAQGCDLIVLAPVSAGAEVLADGNIHVYASLRGRALAGVKGDTSARIFIRRMEAELVSVAGCYRMVDEQTLGDLDGQPVQIYLNGERLLIEPMA